MTVAIYEQRDGLYVASAHARGPWDPAAQHGGAPAALLAREIERVEPGAGMVVARVTYEFLGPVPLTPLAADAWVHRPGRRFQLIEGELRAGSRTVVRARAVRLRRGDVALPDASTEGTPVPCEGPLQSVAAEFPVADGLDEGFHRSAMDIRFAGGTSYGGGPALTWFRLKRPLVAGEVPSGLQRVAAAADFGNGVSSVLDFSEHLFVNTDLTLHMAREPQGEWVLLDARTVLDPLGIGLSASKLYDEHRDIGLAAQTLYVDRR